MNIITALKVAGVAAVLGIMAWGAYQAYQFHLAEIDEAVESARLKIAAEQQKLAEDREDILKVEADKELQRIEKELRVERAKVRDLQRMLLIEHDLDRLLQSKPGLILPRVNKGTEEVLKELEELTQ